MSDSPTVLITGCSTGIGAACALELDRRGFRVFAGVRGSEAAERLRQQATPRLTPLLLDVTDAAAIRAAAEQVGQAVGSAGLAGLVNNAGIAVCGPLELLPLDELRRQFEVNLVGHLAVTQAVMPLLRAAQGRIVNISSLNGAVSTPFLGPYAASKHALEALSDALRMELRHSGVRVALIEPGPIATPIWEKSAAAADGLAATVAPEVLEPYHADVEVFRAAAERMGRNGLPVDHVVRAVVHALTARCPKVRYFIDWRTRACFKIFKMLPDRFRDWMICRELGLR